MLLKQVIISNCPDFVCGIGRDLPTRAPLRVKSYQALEHVCQTLFYPLRLNLCFFPFHETPACKISLVRLSDT